MESFDLVGGVGGHNGQFVLSAFFCIFVFQYVCFFCNFSWKVLICVVVLVGTTGRRCNFYCHIFSCFKFCIFELLCFDLCGGVGGHNVAICTFSIFALLHFQHFFLESFDLCAGVGGHNRQEVQRDGVKIAASQPPLVYSM